MGINTYKKANKGFTFIELIIVIGVIGITLPVIFNLFFVTLRTQVRLYSLQEVKRNGDFALNVIESLILNDAKSIVSDYTTEGNTLCTDTGNADFSLGDSLNIRTKDTEGFRFHIVADNGVSKIASDSTTTAPATSFLTNNKVNITNLTFTCKNSSIYNNPLVTVRFTVTKAVTAGASFEETASLTYQTKIRLRNQ